MKIYFAGSITGGRQDKDLYIQIISKLSNFGTVLTEHIGDPNLSSEGEIDKTPEFIFTRDIAWLTEADVVVAEVTVTSLGVGYELGRAEDMGKHILCLCRPSEGKRLSSMITGNDKLDVKMYNQIEELDDIFEKFFK